MRARGVGQRRTIASYRDAMPLGRRRLCGPVIGVVAARDFEWRVDVYRKQNQARGPHNAGPDGLTPRQRRRVTHKENAAR